MGFKQLFDVSYLLNSNQQVFMWGILDEQIRKHTGEYFCL